MMKFREDKSPTILLMEISRVKVELKEKIKEFIKRFLTLLNKILIYL